MKRYAQLSIKIQKLTHKIISFISL